MINKKPNYYVIVIIIIISSMTIYNYFRINADNYAAQNHTNIESGRLASLSNLLNISGKRINDTTMIDAVTLKKEAISFVKPTLIIMLSNFGCSRCQNRELKNIIKYINSVANNKINLIAIGNTTDRDVLLKLKKVTQTNIPMYYNNTAAFINNYKVDEKFPQYLFAVNNRVVYTFLPIQDDDKFSEWYFSILKKNNQYYDE